MNIPIKTTAEIKSMRIAGRILSETLQLLKKEAKAGMSTQELDLIAENFILSHEGAKPGFKGYNGFPSSICTSINEEVVHGMPSQKRILKEGDIIGLDCGVLYGGMHTDACITIGIGEIKPEINHFLKTTKKALSKAIKLIKSGTHVGDLSAIIQKTLEQQGYEPVIECTGHGVGKSLHEPPEILNAGKKGTGPKLKAGMTIAVEPISAINNGQVTTASDGWTVVTADKSLSAHFEHTILVTENGHEILTDT